MHNRKIKVAVSVPFLFVHPVVTHSTPVVACIVPLLLSFSFQRCLPSPEGRGSLQWSAGVSCTRTPLVKN